MSDIEEPTIESVIHQFVNAEQALLDLREEEHRLLEATTRFLAADDENRERSRIAVDALEEARARLRQEVLSGESLTKGTGELHHSLAETVAEVGRVMQVLRGIDPAAMTRDLGELRRDGADNATEVRELRRLTSELQRTHEQLIASHATLVTEHTAVAARLRFILPVSIATFVAAVTGLIIGLMQ